MRKFTLLLAAFAAPVAAVPALACTPAPGYRVPTNLELAADANAIILGQVVGDSAPITDDPESAGIMVRPIDAIKGLLPSGDLRIAGTMLAEGEDAELSNQLEFSEAHPSAYRGACIRYAFPQDATVLFFLDREDGQWKPAGGPFSRWAEDVPGRGAPWVQLAALYAEAALKTPEERIPFLEGYRQELLAREGDEIARLMAGDIERQLAGPNPPLRADLPPAPLPPLPEEEDGQAPAADAPPPPPPSSAEPVDNLGNVEAALDAMGRETR